MAVTPEQVIRGSCILGAPCGAVLAPRYAGGNSTSATRRSRAYRLIPKWVVVATGAPPDQSISTKPCRSSCSAGR
jgi:hypothetical protein